MKVLFTDEHGEAGRAPHKAQAPTLVPFLKHQRKIFCWRTCGFTRFVRPSGQLLRQALQHLEAHQTIDDARQPPLSSSRRTRRGRSEGPTGLCKPEVQDDGATERGAAGEAQGWGRR